MAGFGDLAALLGELETIPSRIAKACATSFTTELHNQFLKGVDSYGSPWDELAPYTIAKKGHDTILVENGDLANGTRAVAMSGAGIELISTPIGGIHQEGDLPRMPARPVLPDRDELPQRWLNIIQEESDKAFKRVL